MAAATNRQFSLSLYRANAKASLQLGAPDRGRNDTKRRDGWKALGFKLALVPRIEANGLFNHLIGTQEERLRYVETNRLSGFKIDSRFVFGGRLNG